ncbi:putative bifunctional diguanylate cyclase/phosphodiesterase [Sphingomonas glacialis]|uniref:EAL domain-containing protein n=1 Tax=Sphingomonas glacialis TaxID=658225 RepID=A0A502FF78_9SPHN|nr:EAL domain-containing protein [Sphingomonas glacialis]TPG48021.1 EAL domain-containing protein [Sphingomonas glacialis]
MVDPSTLFQKPADEEARLACLPACDILGIEPETEYDHLTKFAADLFNAQICLVWLVGRDEVWMKAHWGLDEDRGVRDASFCTHTILTADPLIVLDATLDERFRDNPNVVGGLAVRFYASAPIINKAGVKLGALCIIDRVPRPSFSDGQRRLLVQLATMVSERLDARREARTDVAIGSFAQTTGLAIITADAGGIITFWNDAARIMFGYARSEAVGRQLEMIMPERFRKAHRSGLVRLGNGGASALAGKSVEVTALHREGREFPIELSVAAWSGSTGMEFGAHIQDISARRAREADLHHFARHDGLTGLLNRGGFRACVEDCLQAHGSASVLVLDLDCFKSVNDTLGHAVGDALLQTIAVRMTTCVEGEGVLGRIGGDEFALLVSCRSDLIAARATAQRLLEAFSEPFEIAGHDLQIGTSIGIAIAPLHAGDSDELLVRADLALLRAKGAGGRTFKVFDAGMANQLAARRAFKDEMRQAYLDGQWALFYQPQVRLSDGKLIGAEALLRWRHPTRGLLLPAAFMPVLETHLLAYEVGCWVIDEACRQLVEWRAQGLCIDRVGINLFAAQVRAGTLETVIGAALERHALQPCDLELEITETIVLGHDDGVLEPLRKLHNMGIGIAFDDFGTGFASLSTLKGFPLSRLKIDRSFVEDICSEPHSIAIVRAVSAMGQSLGLNVIAEGIETLEQADMVATLGCNEGQGYLYGRPYDGVSFPAFVIASSWTKLPQPKDISRQQRAG